MEISQDLYEPPAVKLIKPGSIALRTYSRRPRLVAKELEETNGTIFISGGLTADVTAPIAPSDSSFVEQLSNELTDFVPIKAEPEETNDAIFVSNDASHNAEFAPSDSQFVESSSTSDFASFVQANMEQLNAEAMDMVPSDGSLAQLDQDGNQAVMVFQTDENQTLIVLRTGENQDDMGLPMDENQTLMLLNVEENQADTDENFAQMELPPEENLSEMAPSVEDDKTVTDPVDAHQPVTDPAEEEQYAVVEGVNQSEPDPSEKVPTASVTGTFVHTSDSRATQLTEGQTYFACPVCMNLFEEMSAAQRHIDCHREDSKYFHCYKPKCTAFYEHWVMMEQHLDVHDALVAQPTTKSSVFIKKAPTKVQEKPEKLDRRPATDFTGKTPYGCPYCLDDRFGELDEINFHFEFHNSDDELIHCPFCETAADSWIAMQQGHLAEHAEVPVRMTLPSDSRCCPICSNILDCPDDLIRHCDAIHANDQSITCDVCSTVSPNFRQFLEHRKSHAGTTFECSECQVQTRTYKAMVEHQQIHQGVGFVCGNCGLVCGETHVELHKVACVRGRERKECTECRRQFNGATAYRLHQQHFHAERLNRWPCNKCSYVGRTKNGLQLHLDRVHNKSFKCTECRYACLMQHTLVKHMLLYHSDPQLVDGNADKTLSCSKCLYQARDPQILAQHMSRVHRAKPDAFPCNVCDASFRTQMLLNDHMPSHSSATKEEFACKLCIFSAKFRPALYRHILNKHPGITLSKAILRVPEVEPIFRGSSYQGRSIVKTVNNVAATTTVNGAIPSPATPRSITHEQQQHAALQSGSTEIGAGNNASLSSESVETVAGRSAALPAAVDETPVEVFDATVTEAADGSNSHNEITSMEETYLVDADGHIVLQNSEQEVYLTQDSINMGDGSETEPRIMISEENGMDLEACEFYVISKGGRLSQILTTHPC